MESDAHGQAAGYIRGEILMALKDLGVENRQMVVEMGTPLRDTRSCRWRSNGGLAAREFAEGDSILVHLISAPVEVEFGHTQPLGDVHHVSSARSVIRKMQKGRRVSVKEKTDMMLSVKNGPHTVIAAAGDPVARSITAGVMLRTKDGPVVYGDWVTVAEGDGPGNGLLSIPVRSLYKYATIPVPLQDREAIQIDLNTILKGYLGGLRRQRA